MIDHEFFLRPKPCPTYPLGQPLSTDKLDYFCSNTDFLAPLHLKQGFQDDDHAVTAQQTVNHMNMHRTSLLLQNRDGSTFLSASFREAPVVWDSGASYGLSAFRGDFIDYEECEIPVQDISRTNIVIGIGTVMWKFYATNGDRIYLPCLCYHLPSAEIRLFSPQTYHQLYGGSSEIDGDHVTMFLPKQSDYIKRHNIEIPVDRKGTNLPLAFNVSCTEAERNDIGPNLRSSLAKHELDFFNKWNVAVDEHEYTFCHPSAAKAEMMCCPCVGCEDNYNLTGPQRELLHWHWKLGVSMSRIQEMMVEHQSTDTNNAQHIMPQVIKPRFKTTSCCPIPLCTSCELSRAKKRNPNVIKQQIIKEKEGILAADKYEAGDFVSMDQFVVKTPGRLPTGYGREAPGNRFHGGTIFNDAATGIIWVENQISLGAGETILSKSRFEEWLWELACVEINHLRSDNGVFIAEEFRQDCSDKNQTQSFSGVGAQHQNARAERAIQTIMYMARTFMLHVSLHWTDRGVDDLALWPFAVKHAVWLYNRVPNRVTGLTPIELLTKTKADHRDLLRMHVWGCPTFVLDARLQDGKKIPKWNRRSRLGQFLGFSEEHSSLIANIRHLTTGHVSPQYHCVFDDLFQTVYSAGENTSITDAICDLLWENNRDIYAEEEYDNDGMLVYQPPPLDKVWLDEPERREREHRLRKQRTRQHDIELDRRNTIPHTPVPVLSRRNTPVPDLTVITNDDDDASLSSNDSLPQDQLHESEGEMWADHPSVILAPQEHPIQPNPSNLPNQVPMDIPPDTPEVIHRAPEGAGNVGPEVIHRAPEGAGNVGPTNQSDQHRPQQRRPRRDYGDPQWVRDENGRMRRLNFANMTREQFDNCKSNLTQAQQQQYYVSMSAHRLLYHSPQMNRLSRKKKSYRKRMNYQREVGDHMLSSMHLGTEVPTVEDIMNSPLSRFIKFAANDCGYKGSTRELIVNWVHPFFLKAQAAASKDDNPNWWEAMRGPFADEFWKAAIAEIETLEKMGAWEVVDRPEKANVIDSTWAFKLKRFPDGLVKKFKARFCARGDQQIEGVDFFETYAPVVQWTTVRLMLILEVLLDLKSKQGDITAAFLHATLKEDEEVYVEMPRGFQKKGKVLKLKKTLYGLRQSPRAFWKYMVEKMEASNMPQSKLDPCLFVGEKVIAICYVDDLIFWARNEQDIHELAIKLRSLGVDLEQEDDAAGFLGVRLERDTTTGLMEMKQEGLINRVIEALGLDAGMINGKATPAESKPLVKDVDGENALQLFSYSSVVGMLLYLAGHTRPDIAYAVNCCARYMFNPKRSHEEALKRIGRYLKATRTRGLILNPTEDILKIDSYPDADFAGMYGYEENTDPASVKSRTGYVINVAGCPVLWQSKLQSETALSTMEAEIIAMAHSCRELFPIMDMVSELGPAVSLKVGPTTMNVSIHEDNAGALILAETLPPQYTPRSKHYAIKTIWFREQIVRRGIKLLKIDTCEQLGDIFTKSLAKPIFEYLRKKLMGW